MPLRVYLSSTFLDLKKHRQAAKEAILQSGFDVSAMEDYVAASEQPSVWCVEDVLRCQVYLGLFGFRYGYVPPGAAQSITEMELRAAEHQGLIVLVFLLDEKVRGHCPPSAIDQGLAGQRIEGLRSELARRYVVKSFETAGQLGGLVAAALARSQQEFPRQQAARLLKNALAYLYQGAFGPAASALDQALRLDNRNAWAWYYRALVLLQGAPLEAAPWPVIQQMEQFASAAQNLDPENGLVMVLRAGLRHYYFDRKGLRSPPPAARELLGVASRTGLDPQRLQELLRLLQIDGRFQ